MPRKPSVNDGRPVSPSRSVGSVRATPRPRPCPSEGRTAAFVTCVACILCGGVSGAGEADKPARRSARLRLSRVGSMCVIDDSLYSLAELYMGEGRVEDAIAQLRRVVEKSPDEETRSATHFNLAQIYEKNLKDPERARKEYACVTGIRGAGARARVLGPLRRDKRWDEVIAFLKECLAVPRKPEEKAGLVKRLIREARASGSPELIESTLRSVPDLITYEEATAAAKVATAADQALRRKIEERRSREGGRRRQPWRRRPALPADRKAPAKRPAEVPTKNGGDAGPGGF